MRSHTHWNKFLLRVLISVTTLSLAPVLVFGATVPAGTAPYSVAVNPVTNKIYVANYSSQNVTVIDGATNATTTVMAGSYPDALAVNPVTNKIYVANYGSQTTSRTGAAALAIPSR
jgi:YVTN family beta-propeller protein